MAEEKKPDITTVSSILDGNDSFIDRWALEAFAALLERTPITSPFAFKMCAAAEADLDLPGAGIAFPIKRIQAAKGKKKTDENYYVAKNGQNRKVEPRDWKSLKRFVAAELKDLQPSKPDALHSNLMNLADYLGMDETEKKVLGLVDLMDRAPSKYADFFKKIIGDKISNLPSLFARMMGAESREDLKKISKVLSPMGPLIGYGIMISEDPDDYEDKFFFPKIERGLHDQLAGTELDQNAIVSQLLGKPAATPLTLADYDYMKEEVTLLTSYIKNASDQGLKGVNLMFYGPVGGGKTELAKALAAGLGKTIYVVAEDDDPLSLAIEQDDRKTSTRRMAHLMRAQALLGGRKDVLLLFDEAEDLLRRSADSEKSKDADSKIRLNRLLETNEIPVIYIANDREKFHEAVLDRIKYSVELESQPAAVRARVWERQLKINNVTLPPGDVMDLARRFDVAPRRISHAVEVMAASGGGKDTIIQTLRAKARLTQGYGGAFEADEFIPAHYDPAFISAGANTKGIVGDLVARGQAMKPFSLFINQKPGAGATSFVRYIAEQSCRAAEEVDINDLLQPSMMSTPVDNIRRVFRTAADKKIFLAFNNIHTLVENAADVGGTVMAGKLRRTFIDAARQHNVPFAVMTNKKDAKFPETFMGIFSHEVDLGYLDNQQVALAYQKFFDRKAPGTVSGKDEFTPADFVGARHALEICDMLGKADDAAIVDALEKQKKARHDSLGSTMGFNQVVKFREEERREPLVAARRRLWGSPAKAPS